MCSPRRLNSRMHKDARKSWNFPEGESTETVKILYSAAQRKAKRRHFVLCELSRLSLELNATHIHIFESVYKRARNIHKSHTENRKTSQRTSIYRGPRSVGRGRAYIALGGGYYY